MCYFDNIFRYPEATVKTICHALRNPIFDDPDCLVGIGLSGSSTLMAVSIESGIQFVILRKDLDAKTSSPKGGSHSGSILECARPIVRRYVIIDDLISSGRTIDTIQEIMARVHPTATCVGIILFQASNTFRYVDFYRGIPLMNISKDIADVDDLIKA